MLFYTVGSSGQSPFGGGAQQPAPSMGKSTFGPLTQLPSRLCKCWLCCDWSKIWKRWKFDKLTRLNIWILSKIMLWSQFFLLGRNRYKFLISYLTCFLFKGPGSRPGTPAPSGGFNFGATSGMPGSPFAASTSAMPSPGMSSVAAQRQRARLSARRRGRKWSGLRDSLFAISHSILRFYGKMQESELSSVITQTVPLERTHQELSCEWSHL